MLYTYNDVRYFPGYKDGKYVYNFELVLTKLSHNNTFNLTDWILMPKKTDLYKKCICSHKISNDYYRKNKYNNNEVVLGCVCIVKYFNEGSSDVRYTDYINNPNVSLCVECKNKLPNKTVIKLNEYNSELIHKSCKDKRTTITNEFNKKKKNWQNKISRVNKIFTLDFVDKPINEIIHIEKIKRYRQDKNHLIKKLQYKFDTLKQKRITVENYKMGNYTKYPNGKLCGIYKCDPSYIIWLSKNCYNKQLKEYAKFLLKKPKPNHILPSLF